MSTLRPKWEYKCFTVWLEEFPENIEEYNGVIITGSPASVHDNEKWITKLLELIRQSTQKCIPMFGACFGHQAIAHALGGEVNENQKGGWSIGKENTKFMQNAPYDLADQDVNMYSFHKQEVTKLPDKAIAIGNNEFCKFPAFVIGNHIFTSQYHPEMTEKFLTELTYEVKGITSEKQLEKARQEFKTGHQGQKFAKAIVEFFEKANKIK